ncbi:MAG: hypothetical protein HY782_07745 [Chloroflexi bacterium]|nr:hypothetical protein [Chloroflexota bacterium]
MSSELILGLATFGAFFVLWGVLPSRLAKKNKGTEGSERAREDAQGHDNTREVTG